MTKHGFLLFFLKDGSLPFARSIKDVHSEFRLLSKLTELLMKQKHYEEALQYATLAVQVSATTGKTFTSSDSSDALPGTHMFLKSYNHRNENQLCTIQ